MKHETQSVPGEGVPVDSDDLRVTEGIHGQWHYHLARPGEFLALCGARVMNTAIPIASWGLSGNPELHERWCSKCVSASRINDGSGEQK